MPLFFILSGISHRYFGVGDKSIVHQALAGVAVPAIFGFFVTWLLYILFKYFLKNDYNSHIFFKEGYGGIFSAYWFLGAILIVMLFGSWLVEFVGSMGALIISCVIGVGIWYVNSAGVGVPKILVGACYGLQFYVIGHIVPIFIYKLKNNFEVVVIIVLFAAGFLVCGEIDLYLDISAKNLGVIFLSQVAAVFFSFLFIMLSFFLAGVRGLSVWIAKIGKASLFILLYHQLVHVLVNDLFPGVQVFFVLLFSVIIPSGAFYFIRGKWIFSRWLGAK